MPATPITILNRPFAVEPTTNIMMPDGIFDAAIYIQRITCHLHNTANRDLTEVTILMEGISDPGIVLTPVTHHFSTIPAGAAVMVSWLANFQNAAPGKPVVSVVAQEVGNNVSRSLKQIFVSRTTYDTKAQKFTCEVPEGKLEVTNLTAITSNGDSWKPGCTPDAFEHLEEELSLYLPIAFDSVFIPNPPYAGIHGELPFNDPWWKIVAVIVAIIAVLTGIIAAANSAAAGSSGPSPTAPGSFRQTSSVDPSIACCAPDLESVAASMAPLYGALAAVTTGAIVVALADQEDPWWRGQAKTQPDKGAITQAEKLSTNFEYLDPPNAGVPYRMRTSWIYQRQTTTGIKKYSVKDEVQENIHLVNNIKVVVPSRIQAFSEELSIKASFTRPNGELFSGPELFTFAVVLSPDAKFSTIINLSDDGILPDENPNDGIYTGEILLESVYSVIRKQKSLFEGRWRVLIFAQDVNLADERDLPHIQAQTIGGFMIANPISISFDTSLPCPITAQATVDVVT